MKSILLPTLVLVLCCALFGTLNASGWDNGLIGARAAGMVAAFVGLADDASAVFYNPAALTVSDSRFQAIIA